MRRFRPTRQQKCWHTFAK